MSDDNAPNPIEETGRHIELRHLTLDDFDDIQSLMNIVYKNEVVSLSTKRYQVQINTSADVQKYV